MISSLKNFSYRLYIASFPPLNVTVAHPGAWDSPAGNSKRISLASARCHNEGKRIFVGLILN